MNRRTAIQGFLVAGAGCLFRRVFAQSETSQQQEEEPFVLRSEVRLVLLDVSVTTRRGGFVSGLAKDNFTVLENGRRQNITVFDNEDRPVTVGILVDESRSMAPKRADTLAAAEIFIAQSNSQDETFVLNFNERVTPGLPPGTLFSDDPVQLRSALRRGVPEGKTALNDAVVAGLKQLELGKRGKKTLIVISDGGDNASVHTPRQVIDMAERTIATIYAIGLFDADDPDRDPGLLRRFANISGGEAYFPQSPAEMTPICKAIAKDIRSRYTIGYVPAAGVTSVRQIRVLASAPGQGNLITRTRSSYQYDQA